jgi:hypothetical protein
MSLQIKSAHRGMAGRVSQGDPGIWGFLKGAAKTGVSFATGGPLAAAKTLKSQIGGGAPITADSAGACPAGLYNTWGPGVAGGKCDPVGRSLAPLSSTNGNGTISIPRPGVVGAFERLIPGGETGMVQSTQPSGYHANKSSYWLMDGTFVPKGTRWVKNRRRNPANARALSRAIGRIDLGKKLQSTLAGISTSRFTAAGKKKQCKAC